MKQLDMRARFMGGDMVKSPTFLSLAGEAAEGMVASLPGMPLEQMPGGKAYVEHYKRRFKTGVEIYSPYAYDATQAMVAAMREANSSRPGDYLKHLASIRFAGVTAPRIAYDDKGDLLSSAVTLYEVQGGKWQVKEAVQ